MICITVERLTLIGLLFNIIPFIISKKFSNPAIPIDLTVIDADFYAISLARQILAWGNVKVSVLSFRLTDLYDKRGNLFRLTTSYHDLIKVQSFIMADPYFHQIFIKRASDDSLLFYSKKAAISFVWNDAASLWRLLIINYLADWARHKGDHQQRQVVLFADQRVWTKPFNKYTDQSGVDIKYIQQFNINVKELIKDLLGPIRLRLMVALIKRVRIVTPLEIKPVSLDSCKLMLEHYGLCNLDEPQFYSDFSFWQQSTFDGKDIILATGFAGSPLNEENFNELTCEGMSVVAVHPQATLTKQIPMFYAPPVVMRKRRIEFIKNSSYLVERRWFKKLFKNYEEQYHYYYRLFVSYNVKIYVTWFKYEALHVLVAEAVRNAGGLIVLYQRSVETASNPETATYCDVFFGFSSLGAQIERESGSQISYYVVTGYLGDHRFSLLKDEAMHVRKQLMNAGAKRIIAFFDENSGPDSRWHTGHEFMRVNYNFLLKKMLDNPDIGLVLKPKVSKTLRSRLGPDRVLLEEALLTGRCFLYEDSGIQSAYPPAVAALSADLAIHGHLCAATAGIEAALTGVPTLLLDREGWPDCCLYQQLDEGKVIFKSWETLWQAYENNWQSPVQGFGDWSDYLDKFDPFRDGRASERMGEYLKTLMEGFKKKLPREQVLAQAAEEYAKRWGKDKVIKIN